MQLQQGGSEERPTPEKSKLGNRLVWATIFFFLLLTCVWGLWAMRQPAVQTLWAPGE